MGPLRRARIVSPAPKSFIYTVLYLYGFDVNNLMKPVLPLSERKMTDEYLTDVKLKVFRTHYRNAFQLETLLVGSGNEDG